MIYSMERSDLYCMIFCTQYCKKTTWILSLIPSLELFTFVIPGPFIADYSVLAVLIFKGLVVTKSSTSFCTIEERCLNWQLYMYNIFLFLDKMIGYYLITLCACDKSNHLYHVVFFFFCSFYLFFFFLQICFSWRVGRLCDLFVFPYDKEIPVHLFYGYFFINL